MKTASSNTTSFVHKLRYGAKLMQMRLRGGNDEIGPWADIERFQLILKKYNLEGRADLRDHQVLEIGYGARPWRLISLSSLGVNIRGIDLDQPTYGFSVKRLIKVLRANGLERFIKTLVRSLLFDGRDLRKLKNEIAHRNGVLT
jgi:hypothetical protein